MPTDAIKSRLGSQRFSFGLLRELHFICEAFGITRQAAKLLCAKLRVPLLYVGNGAMFSQFAFDRAIYSMIRWGGTGFAAPGSKYKGTGKKNRGKDSTVLFEITDECLAKMDNPAILAEMYFASGHREKAAKMLADVLKKLKPAVK